MKKEIYRWEINRDKERDIVLNAIKRSMSFMGVDYDDDSTVKNQDCEFFVLFKKDILDILKLRLDSEKEMNESNIENYGEPDKHIEERIKKLKQVIKLLNEALSDN